MTDAGNTLTMAELEKVHDLFRQRLVPLLPVVVVSQWIPDNVAPFEILAHTWGPYTEPARLMISQYAERELRAMAQPTKIGIVPLGVSVVVYDQEYWDTYLSIGVQMRRAEQAKEVS